MFRIRSEEELKKKLARRQKRAHEKANKNKEAGKDHVSMGVDENEPSKTPDLTDKLVPYTVVRPSGKIRSFSFPRESQSTSTAKNFSVCFSQIE